MVCLKRYLFVSCHSAWAWLSSSLGFRTPRSSGHLMASEQMGRKVVLVGMVWGVTYFNVLFTILPCCDCFAGYFASRFWWNYYESVPSIRYLCFCSYKKKVWSCREWRHEARWTLRVNCNQRFFTAENSDLHKMISTDMPHWSKFLHLEELLNLQFFSLAETYKSSSSSSIFSSSNHKDPFSSLEATVLDDWNEPLK